MARYADTRGYALQQEPNFPYAYTYRDYVVRSFNEDLPYDQFVVEQLAADQLPPGADNRNLAALGFLTVGRKFLSRNDDFDDQVDVVTRGMLGLTVACARCHDHKYDAIPTEDYYSLFGIFANCRQPDDLPFLGNPADSPGYAMFQAEQAERRKAMDDFAAERHAAVIAAARENVDRLPGSRGQLEIRHGTRQAAVHQAEERGRHQAQDCRAVARIHLREDERRTIRCLVPGVSW